jgi:ribosomal protein S18 acetylase RimI-like enzyme
MSAPEIAFVDATPAHFEAIVRIERAAGGSSIVVLTEGLALAEAVERGHYVSVALEDGSVAGWIWFSVDAGRGELIGLVYRVAVAPGRARSGIGRALVEHAQQVLAERGATRVRAVVPGGDDATRAFFAGLGYQVDALTMEHPL